MIAKPSKKKILFGSVILIIITLVVFISWLYKHSLKSEVLVDNKFIIVQDNKKLNQFIQSLPKPLSSIVAITYNKLVTVETLLHKPSFTNVIAQSGIKIEAGSWGASWYDYDSDGYLDLFIAGGKNGNKLYHNNGNRTFTDVTKKSGLSKSYGSTHAGVWADYDNDGCGDLFLSNGRFSTSTPWKSLMYHGNCDGTFSDVTEKAGINASYTAFGASWADYDNDGFLDLYIANRGNTKRGLKVKMDYTFEPNILYHNNRNGTFTNVTEKSGAVGYFRDECKEVLQRPLSKKMTAHGGPFKFSFQPIWFDFNNDGKIDLFIANDGGISPLYRNNGDGTFTNVTGQARLCKNGSGMGVTVGDYNGQGYFSIFVTNVGRQFLWQNNGDGTFKEVAKVVGVDDRLSIGWGTGFIDYDNDGSLDLYVVDGNVLPGVALNPEIGKVTLDKLYKNLGQGKFASVSAQEGILGDDPKEAAAFADYDNNGFEDVVVISGPYEKTSQARLYKNRGNSNHSLTVQLVGTKSNRDGVGAKLVLQAGNKSQARQVISGDSYLSQNSLWQIFGLGSSKSVDKLTITWPSGIVQVLTGTKANQKIVVVEK